MRIGRTVSVNATLPMSCRTDAVARSPAGNPIGRPMIGRITMPRCEHQREQLLGAREPDARRIPLRNACRVGAQRREALSHGNS
jgi:hypothetical protein